MILSEIINRRKFTGSIHIGKGGNYYFKKLLGRGRFCFFTLNVNDRGTDFAYADH